MSWEFWIDVGGTFTDCIARAPDDRLIPVKVLSSSVTKGRVEECLGTDRISDSHRDEAPANFWAGYRIRFLDEDGMLLSSSRITRSVPGQGILGLETPVPPNVTPGTAYELSSDEDSPILAIRRVLGLRLNQPIPEISVKLGTTRGTNALLTRTGARTALVTTRGFADVLRIGNQDRPHLFELAVTRPQPLFESVVEFDERIDSEGRVLRAPNQQKLLDDLTRFKKAGIESVAICLMHSFANGDHERLAEEAARQAGFGEISTSSRLAPLIKIVSRGDTTVMDAYLNPILRAYVGRLRTSLGKSHLKIMTSAGGLVDADRFVGKDSILSGPAGGVIGFSRIAERAGFDKSIGFDMGGTSTDVSRFDGTYELEFETMKAGVRVVAPMLAIETVAAGGGSICGFDGVKLHVGPESAGAEPGPACYGLGGPLTVTDVNLFLGKILPERFPFPLDRQAVAARLDSLCEQIVKSPLGKRYTPRELAEGFVHIANANMVRAIRKISVAKGYDPAEYALVTFGGAGAQHACAIARALGIRRVLVHPFSGILSAYGIGLADVRRFGERAVLKPYNDKTSAGLETIFAELAANTTDAVRAEGIAEQQIQVPVCSLDMRYAGVEAVINVVEPDDGDYATRYQQLHQQLYGYTHSGRGIEVAAARVEVVGKMAQPAVEQTDAVPRTPEPALTTETCFENELHETGVFFRQDLRAGDELAGPAIVCEPTSTVVIDPGFVAVVTERGEILISMVESARNESEPATAEPGATSETATSHTQPAIPADPVMLEIFNNLFASIAEQMGIMLQRTSFSTNVKERLDFSCAIFSPDGDLVVNAPHIPVHLGAMSETVKRILADNPGLGPGDVFVTNDPYRGGSHLPDVTVVSPVHDPTDGELLFVTASRAHHAEIGGIVPGSMPPFSKNLGEEGVLIRNFPLVERGVSREAELKSLLSSGPFPSRSVADNLADVSAQVAANNSGVRQLEELVARYTLPVVQAYMGHIQRAAAEKMRMALAAIGDGTYQRTDHLDNGAPICASITIRGDRATVDFTGTGPVLETNLNANRAIVTAAVLYVFRCLIDEDIPLNSGVLEPVDIILPECLLNPPERDAPEQCAAVVGGNVETSQRVVDTLLGALGVAAASQGTMNNLTFGNESFGYYETICGGSGATPTADGISGIHTHMTNTRLTDAEVIERRYPVRVREFALRKGSGGTGAHCGGDGIIRRLEFLEPLKVSMLSERRGEFAPFGLAGGNPGALGRNSLQRSNPSRSKSLPRTSSNLTADGNSKQTVESATETSEPTVQSISNDTSIQDLGGKFAIEVQPGDVLTIETPGGGGYGAAKIR